MSVQEIKLPKLGESISEATILRWLKQKGDHVEKDEAIVEVATDKVDSEVAAPASGIIEELLYEENDVVKVGEIIAKLSPSDEQKAEEEKTEEKMDLQSVEDSPQDSNVQILESSRHDGQGRFLSPLVRSMAAKEGISVEALSSIQGSGSNGRILKKDILAYLENGVQLDNRPPSSDAVNRQPSSFTGGQEIIEMDRMRSMIADHMVESKRTSPHVTAYVEVDVTKIVEWREKNKVAFQQKYGEKITFTPIFVEAVIKALEEYPMVNVSVDGKKIIRKKEMNIGMAAALPTGNLIVPVIHGANQYSLLGLTKKVNELTDKARTNKLNADEIQGGTFTISNVGTFRNLMGTPIINQPQVAILATGAIKKRPAVVETEYGDMIAIRQMMYLSLSFDHRVVDGNLGGSFLARIMDHLEAFDPNRSI